MPKHARFDEYQGVRLKQNRPSVEEHPITELDVPRAVTTSDHGIIVHVHDTRSPGYMVEFFGSERKTVDVLTLNEDELEPIE